MDTYPLALQRFIDHFTSLTELERREGLIDLADSVSHYAPQADRRYDFEDVRKDTECSDTVGIHLRHDTLHGTELAISLGCQVQTLTRAMSSILCQGVAGAPLAAVAQLSPAFVESIVGQQLVQLRARTIYYVLRRVKEGAARLLAQSPLHSPP